MNDHLQNCTAKSKQLEDALEELKEIFEKEKTRLMEPGELEALKQIQSHPQFEIYQGARKLYIAVWETLAPTQGVYMAGVCIFHVFENCRLSYV